MKTVTVPVKGLNFAGCGREIEKRLGQLAPILAVEASYVTQTTTITYDETRMTEAQLRKLVEDCGFALAPAPADALGREPQLGLARAGHARRVVVRLDLSFRSLARPAQPHARYERAGEPGGFGRLPLQRLCHSVCPPGGHQLRCGGHARHLRALRSLDGDAQSPGVF